MGKLDQVKGHMYKMRMQDIGVQQRHERERQT